MNGNFLGPPAPLETTVKGDAAVEKAAAILSPYDGDDEKALHEAHTLLACYLLEQDRFINAPTVWDTLKHQKATTLQKPMKATTLRKRSEVVL